jgi:Ribbon-helix-helix protein, copG family
MAPDTASAPNDAGASAPANRRTSFNLSPEAEEAVRELARRRGVSMGEVIRRALSTEKFLADRQAAGAKVLIREPDGSLREVVML